VFEGSKGGMISTVLVPLDGSLVAEQAIPYAQALLPDADAGVLLRVVPEPDPLLTELMWTLESAPAWTETAVARAELDQVKARLADTRIRWITDVAQGDPAAEVLEAIRRHRVDVVAMTTHGRGALGRVTFGSVADRVSRASPIPVLLVRAHPDGSPLPTVAIRRLVVPLDGSVLAEASLPVVVDRAKQLGVPVHLVRALNLAAVLTPLVDGGGLLVSPSPEVYDQMTEAVEHDARDYLTTVATRLEDESVSATWDVLEGSPFFAIADATQTGDLLVTTSHGRGGVLRWLLGSVAEKLVRESPVPVLLVPSASRGTGTAPPDADGDRASLPVHGRRAS
jgi:nucleotide-binding universal stress UspA family protein